MNPIESPALLNQPQAILKAWTALEVLSPQQAYKRPEELISGEGSIAWLRLGRLPWEGGGETSRPTKRLFYHTEIIEALAQRLYRRDEDNRLLPLTSTHLEDMYQWLVQRLRLPAGLIEPPSF